MKTIHLIINRAILMKCKALKLLVTLLVEVETAGIFYNSQIVILIRDIIELLNHL